MPSMPSMPLMPSMPSLSALALAALVAAPLTGCYKDDEVEPGDAPPVEEMIPDEELETPAPEPPAEPLVIVAKTLRFVRAEDGISAGFDLDGRVSERGDRESCGIADFEAPDGTAGIDNTFTNVLPLIEAGGGQALEGFVQEAVNDGDMLVVLEVDGLDDPMNDDSVSVTMLRGVGQPYIGTDGLIESWQTFDVDPIAPWSRDDTARVKDGVLEAGPFEFELPVFVFDFEFELTVSRARLRIEFEDGEPARGVLGGSVELQNMLDIVDNIEGGQRLPGIVRTIGARYADLDPDEEGDCRALSTTIGFELAGAFLYDDTDRPDK